MNNILLARKCVCLGIAAASLLGLTLVGCSADDPAGAGERLPEGKYPMTFTAAVDGLISTRATADGTWKGGEEVAIQIGGTTKRYTAEAGGNLSVASGGTPFYWQNTNSITVNAWYPYNGGTKPADNALTVNADQSGDGYQASDYLEAVGNTVTFQKPELTFKHRTAKVVVTLVNGEGITDLNGAVVTFINQTGVEGYGNEVTPKAETPGSTGSPTTYTALLFPQQMKDNQFIKVTLGGYNYFYTPTSLDEANLTAGQQHTYTVTVKKTGLDVTAQSPTSWKGESVNVDGNAQTVIPGTDGDGVDWTPDGNGEPENVTGSEKRMN